MTENQDPNKSAAAQDGGNAPEGQKPQNKEPDQNPFFPKAAGDVPLVTDKKEEDVDPQTMEVRRDPNYQKFVADSKTPEMMYRRYNDSSKEAVRLKTQAEELGTYKESYEAVRRDFDVMQQSNPALHKQLVDFFTSVQAGDTSKMYNPPNQNETMTEEKMAKIAELQTTLSDFKKEYVEVIKDEGDLKRIRSYAASLAGKDDREGKPFTYRNALAAGLQYYHPEVVADQAKYEAMASYEQRNSASESAAVPLGTGPRTRNSPLTEQEKFVADKFGMSEDDYRRFQQN